MLIVGKIRKEIYCCVAGNIGSEDVIITDNQIRHISEHHPEEFPQIFSLCEETLWNPDYIIEDKRNQNTGLVVKKVRESDKYMYIVLKLCVTEDPPEYKNSIISCWLISEKRIRTYLRNRKILYKRE